MEKFNHLQIQLKDINLEPYIKLGGGGFGPVYKGELSRPKGLITVACKYLDPSLGQGDVEFSREIMLLSQYKHKNLISLLHYCIDGEKKILVYEYASRGSLDRCLGDPSLTWTQRLKICIGVARALKYLHDPADTHQRIIHRDIKSGNILLDEEWNAKVSDFGLSKVGPANQLQTYLVSNPTGTPGYCDPMYRETGFLSEESDVYSFGVVLFEVMCGKLCLEISDGGFYVLVPDWKKCIEEKRLDDIIFHVLKQQMEPASLNTFLTVAYKCLENAREERPTMAEIVQKLEMILEQQEDFEEKQKRRKFEEMRRIADLDASPLSHETQSQLRNYMNGALVDNGDTWFLITEKGQHYELVSAQKCVSTTDYTRFIAPNADSASRFKYLFEYTSTQDLRLKIETQFLSPNVTYVINLVYKCSDKYELRIPLKYKLEEAREYSASCVAHVGERGWLRTELFQFTSTKKDHYFDIHFMSDIQPGERRYAMSISIEGVEFCPIDSEKDDNKVGMQPTEDINWTSDDYTNIFKLSEDIKESMDRKEVYYLLRKGIYINNSQQWFSISKKSKKRLMLPARAILPEESWLFKFLSGIKRWAWKALPAGSRFKEVAESRDYNHLAISVQIVPKILSSDTKYACYLVFKLPENASVFEGIVITSFDVLPVGDGRFPIEHHMYLVTPPHTPIIESSPGERASRTRKIKGHPKLRKDGWMEIQVWEFRNRSTSDDPYRRLGYLKSLKGWKFTGLLVQGIELRPAKVSWYAPVLYQS